VSSQNVEKYWCTLKIPHILLIPEYEYKKVNVDRDAEVKVKIKVQLKLSLHVP
jgi:hypothetical protein